MKTAPLEIQSAFNSKSNLQIVAGLGVLLLLAFAAFYKSPTSAKSRSLLSQAQVLMEKPGKQNAAQALLLLNEAARLTPQKTDVYTTRGYAYELLEENKKAAADYSYALSLKAGDAWTHTHYARVLLGIGQTRPALKETQRAISLEPQNDNAHYFQGIAYQRLEMVPEALQAFDKAVEIAPDAARIRLSRAQLFRRQGNNKRALEDCSAAIRYGSGDILNEAHILRGTILMDEKKFQKAKSDFDAVITIDAKSWRAFYFRGMVYLNLKKYPSALKDLNRAIAIEPKNWLAFYNRGYAYQELQKFALALSDFNQAIKLNPKSGASYGNRARILMRRKEWKKAIADYTTALALNKEYDSAYTGRGWANIRLDNPSAAERDYTVLIQQKKAFERGARFSRTGALDAISR